MLHLFSSRQRSHAPRVKPDAAQSSPDPVRAVDSFWQQRYFHEPYFVVGRSYDQYRPAYLMGWTAAQHARNTGQSFDDLDDTLEKHWHSACETSLLSWPQVREAARAAWDHVFREAARGDAKAPCWDEARLKSLRAVVLAGRHAHECLKSCLQPMPQGLSGQVLARQCMAAQVWLVELESMLSACGCPPLPPGRKPAAAAAQLAEAGSQFWHSLSARMPSTAMVAGVPERADRCQAEWMTACEEVDPQGLPDALRDFLERLVLGLRGHLQALHWLKRYLA